MASESGKIIYRRFMGRIVESGLLVIAVALGVGAASSGFSLLANTLAASKATLSSVAYRELVVSTRSSADEMAAPAAKKSAAKDAVLTVADLDASGVVPDVAYAYVRNDDDLTFINAAKIQANAAEGGGWGGAPQGPKQGGASQVGQGGQGAPSGQNGQGGAGAQNDGGAAALRQMSADDLKKAEAQADLFVVDTVDRLNGYCVTPQFFDAWKMRAAQGSLLSESDGSSSGITIVLGSSAAQTLVGQGKDPAALVGKKILTFDGYAQVVGILAPTGQESFDASFFSSYKTLASGFTPRRGQFNTQLRFTVSEPSKLDKTEELLSNWFSSRYGENQIVISNPRSEAQKLIARNSGISLLILFLSLSGLFIALVNVSNILMSRGLRMRKGVGIMMALGSSRNAVLALFAREATAISALGAAIGCVFAFPLSASMQAALGISGGSWLYVVAGCLIAWLLTLVFSVAPAWRNSRIVPAEAMRAV